MNKMMRITRSQNHRLTYGLFGLALILYSAYLIGPGLYVQLQNSQLPSSPIIIPPTVQQETQKKVTQGHPERIIIPAVNIDIAVADGYYNQQNGKWTLSKDKAHFAVVSSEPNDNYGNTYIYGHKRQQVFTRLNQLHPGDEVQVVTNNSHTFTYRLATIEETKPNDVGVLLPYNKAPTLSLQTCSGAWYQNRQIFRFDFVDVK